MNDFVPPVLIVGLMIPNKSCLDLPKKISLVFMWADLYGGYGGCQDVTLV